MKADDAADDAANDAAEVGASHESSRTVPTWTRLEASGDMPGGLFGHAAAADSDGRMWLSGGFGAGSFSRELHVFDPRGHVWTRVNARGAKPRRVCRHLYAPHCPGAIRLLCCVLLRCETRTWMNCMPVCARVRMTRGAGSHVHSARHKHTLVATASNRAGSALLLFGGNDFGPTRGFYELSVPRASVDTSSNGSALSSPVSARMP